MIYITLVIDTADICTLPLLIVFKKQQSSMRCLLIRGKHGCADLVTLRPWIFYSAIIINHLGSFTFPTKWLCNGSTVPVALRHNICLAHRSSDGRCRPTRYLLPRIPRLLLISLVSPAHGIDEFPHHPHENEKLPTSFTLFSKTHKKRMACTLHASCYVQSTD